MSGMPLLQPVTVHGLNAEAWLANLEAGETVVTHYAGLLDSGEHERAARFRLPQDRRRFILARGLLRELLASRLDAKPETLRFEYGEHGKPALAGTPLHFNLSHSHERALYALSPTAGVGVDIEYLRRRADHAALSARYFTPEEQARYTATTESERARFFFERWTRKEAVAKASGVGLAYGFSTLDTLQADDGRVLRNSGWLISDLAVDADYVAAIALRE